MSGPQGSEARASLGRSRVPPHRAALGAYRSSALRTRAQARLRWWWCPFPAIEAEVPTEGDVLEIGCGHGLLSCYLAAAAPARRVTGVDIDDDKIVEARAAAGRLAGPGTGSLRFEAVEAGYLPEGRFDAIVVVDVLYLLSAPAQRRLLAAAAGALGARGVLVVKESATTPRWKYRWCRFQETLATRVFGVTAGGGEGLVFLGPEVYGGWLASAGLDVTDTPLHRGYAWPHHLVVARHPQHSATAVVVGTTETVAE